MTDITLPREPTESMIEDMARAHWERLYKSVRNSPGLRWPSLSDKHRGKLHNEMRAAYAALVEHLRKKGNG